MIYVCVHKDILFNIINKIFRLICINYIFTHNLFFVIKYVLFLAYISIYINIFYYRTFQYIIYNNSTTLSKNYIIYNIIILIERKYIH